MRHWKKYALCLACVFCMAMLTGCGKDNKNTVTEKETNAVVTEKDGADKNTDGTQTDKPGDNVVDNNAAGDGSNTAGETNGSTADDGNKTENGAVNDGVVTETDGDVNNVTDKDNNGTENDVLDNNGDNEKGGRIGDAGRDIVDGVGDAGKDIINGVENGVDELTGNTPENSTVR